MPSLRSSLCAALLGAAALTTAAAPAYAASGPLLVLQAQGLHTRTAADGSTVVSLEDFKLVPGDLVSYYATAKDSRAEARTDIAFIQADPFERNFSQAQAAGAGGGGGMGDASGGDCPPSLRRTGR